MIFLQKLRNPNTRALIISPLTSLTNQHFNTIKQYGFNVLARFRGKEVRASYPENNSAALILSPESLFPSNNQCCLLVKQFRPNFVVIDECHCIYEWGHGFRDEFLKIPNWINLMNFDNSLFMSATIRPTHLSRLKSELTNKPCVINEFGLPKQIKLLPLHISEQSRTEFILDWLKKRHRGGVLFFNSRKDAHKFYILAKNIFPTRVILYTGALYTEERDLAEYKIHHSSNSILIATSAFGLGIHCSQLKWAVVFQVPPSVSALAQYAGRVGRGSEDCEVLLFWDYSDFRKISYYHKNENQKLTEISALLKVYQSGSSISKAIHDYYSD